jgi:DNA-binding NarL/FixJ family response regulator
MITVENQLTNAQSDGMHHMVSICSSHPVAAQILKEAIASDGALDFKTRVLTTFKQLELREQGEVLFLDSCCDDAWPKPALRWQRSGGKVLVLFPAKLAHPGNQLRALFLGVKGVVVASGNWYSQVHHAIQAVLEGRLWVSREVLNEYVSRITNKGKNWPGNVDPLLRLTVREEQIMCLLLGSESNKEIGDTLGIAERTVKYHVSNILQKSHVSSRKELLDKMTREEECGDSSTSEYWTCLQTETQVGGAGLMLTLSTRNKFRQSDCLSS